VSRNGRPQYRVEPRDRRLADFEPMCWWHQTSPKSHFTRMLLCSLPTEDSRVTLVNRRLIRTTASGRSDTILDTEEEMLAACSMSFGIMLDGGPDLLSRI
jgi:N-hydroxyarylamine O-acetyltransferase